MHNLADELNLSDSVHYPRWRKDPHKYMSKSDDFVLSSLSESFGNVLVEAMASWCPVAAADYSDAVWEILY